MRSISVLVLKDLRRRLAAPLEVAVFLAIPLVITGMISLAFGGLRSKAKSDGAMPKITIVLVDADRTLLTRMLLGATQDPELANKIEVKRAETRELGLKRLYAEKASALLVLPKGLTDAITGGASVELELVKNPSQQIMPGVAEKGAEMMAFYLSLIARGLGDEAALVRTLLSGKDWPSTTETLRVFGQVRDKLQGSASHLFPPRLTVETEKGEGTPEKDKPDWIAQLFASMYPGLMVMSLLMVGNAAMKDVLQEKARGTLRRMLTAPITVGYYLIAKVLSAAVLVGVAMGLLLAVGTLAFGIRWSPIGALAVASVVTVFAAVGFSATLYALLRSERLADAVSSMIVMLLTFLGGAMFPLNDPPAWLAASARVSPVYWGAQAFRALAGGFSVEPIARSLVVLATIACALVTVGVLILGRRYRRGVL
jgi:ABC-2 type transport system permease protein